MDYDPLSDPSPSELLAMLAARDAQLKAMTEAEALRLKLEKEHFAALDRMSRMPRPPTVGRCPACGRAKPRPPGKAKREANAKRQKAWRDRQKAKAMAERDRREAPMLAAAMERVRKMTEETGHGH